MVCQACGKTWPADTSICPDDGTWLHDETIMDERGRRLRAVSKGDAFPAESGQMRAATVPDVAREPGELGTGDRVGDYEIESKVGEGAMGTVYRAVHPAIGRDVAIKVMTPKVFDEPESIKRFVAEARAVAAIRHPGIVDIFGFGRLPDGRTYLVMEWLEGESLGARLRRGPIPFEEACDFIRQIARALEAAHSKGIIHRDLKPENVFIHHIEGEKPITKLLDFGLAKVIKQEDGLVARTRTGQMLGTPLYMSPEQCKNKGVDHRTDIYALGCMCYELLCGRRPFEADNIAELVSEHLMKEPPRPRSIAPGLPAELDALLFEMVEKEPDNRPSLAHVRRVISQSLNRPVTMPVAATAPPPEDITPAPFAVPPGTAPAAPVKFLPVPGTAPYAVLPLGTGGQTGASPYAGPPTGTGMSPYAPPPVVASRGLTVPWVSLVVAFVIITAAIALVVLLR